MDTVLISGTELRRDDLPWLCNFPHCGLLCGSRERCVSTALRNERRRIADALADPQPIFWQRLRAWWR